MDLSQENPCRGPPGGPPGTSQWDRLQGTRCRGPLHGTPSRGPLQKTLPRHPLEGTPSMRPHPVDPLQGNLTPCRGLLQWTPSRLPHPSDHLQGAPSGGTLLGTLCSIPPRDPFHLYTRFRPENFQGTLTFSPSTGLPSADSLKGSPSRGHPHGTTSRVLPPGDTLGNP